MAEEGLFDPIKLEGFKKPQLIEIILELQREKNEIKTQQLNTKILMDRVTELERSQYLYKQYGRRESVEITGIPVNIEHNNLEREVITIYNEAEVQVHGRQLKS